MRLAPLGIGILWLLTACSYIGQSAWYEKKGNLDEDNDGATFLEEQAADCGSNADNNPLITPGGAEIPYDGIDNDCLDGDLVDADGDGYPGILFADYPEEFADEWPSQIAEDELLDCSDGEEAPVGEEGDAEREAAADVHPGAVDKTGDGIDADCAGDNDFDYDGDNWMEAGQEEAYAAYKEFYGYEFPDADGNFGDCDDEDPTANPGQATDDWYDGVDSDCAGNNDFDADGDQHIRPGASEWNAYEQFVLHYGYTLTAYTGDCLDQDDPAFVAAGESDPVDAATVYGDDPDFDDDAAAPETPYDGIDSDCAGDNDYDSDGDGYMPNGNNSAFSAYIALWGYDSLSAEDGDCNDADADQHPGAFEVLGDAVDQDCDHYSDPENGVDSARFGFGDYGWTDPRTVVVGATDTSYVLVTGATALESGVGRDEVGVSIFFDLDSEGGVDPFDEYFWREPTSTEEPEPLGRGVELLPGTSSFFPLGSYQRASTTFVIARQMTWSESDYDYDPTLLYNDTVPSSDTYLDMDAQVDTDGNIWVFACGAESVHLFFIDTATTFTKDEELLDIEGGTSCFIELDPGNPEIAQGTVIGSSITTYDLDVSSGSPDVTEASVQSWEGTGITNVNGQEDWLAMAHDDGVAVYEPGTGTLHEVLSGYEVTTADVAWVGSTMYVTAVVSDQDGDGVSDVVLGYGAVDSLTVSVFSLTDADNVWSPVAAGVYADSGRVFLAASGTDPAGSGVDTVGWVFLGTP